MLARFDLSLAAPYRRTLMSDITEPVARSRKKRGQGMARRGEILEAAKRIFIEEGVTHATMRRIASAVGVSSTALYVYFPDKDAILSALAEAMFAELLTVIEATKSAGMPTIDRIRAGLRAYILFGLSRPDEYRLIFLARSRGIKVDDAYRSFDILEGYVAALMESGEFRGGSPEAVAEALWACVHGVTALLLDQPQHIASPPEQLVDLVIDLTMRGCLAGG
jgi:AcrR family transcriptional regulator